MTNNIYHRYLDIPVSPNIDLFNNDEYDPEKTCHISIDETKLNPEFIEWLAKFNLSYYFIEVYLF